MVSAIELGILAGWLALGCMGLGVLWTATLFLGRDLRGSRFAWWARLIMLSITILGTGPAGLFAVCVAVSEKRMEWLQEGREDFCSHCGRQISSGSGEVQRADAAEHMAQCEQHPTRALKDEVEAFRARAAVARALVRDIKANLLQPQASVLCDQVLAALEEVKS